MPLENKLKELKAGIEKELSDFFDHKIKEGNDRNKPEEYFDMVENLKSFILGSGKRIRPILFCCGYEIAGGKSKEKILKASLSVELIHSYLLIHDDIMDQDNYRHGKPSMHKKYEEIGNNFFKNDGAKHFGISMAILMGDLASVFGYESLADSDFSRDLKSKAINKLNEIISDTIIGQGLDIISEEESVVSVEDIFQVQKYKTAKYTIEGPLHLGAILAGADEKLLKSISDFAIPLGIAFQIQDDIIGVFGDEKKTGKPVGADIREGKKTLLIAKAMEKADGEQKKTLKKSLGNKEITMDEIDKVREIIESTGSLDFSKDKARELKNDSLRNLEKMEVGAENKKFLKDLADFIVKREY